MSAGGRKAETVEEEIGAWEEMLANANVGIIYRLGLKSGNSLARVQAGSRKRNQYKN
jgi:hypothetical protein